MVKSKLETEKVKASPQKKIFMNKSNTKLPKVDKTENQIIENLKDIQSNLKTKLQTMQQ